LTSHAHLKYAVSSMRAFFAMYQEPQRSTARSLEGHHIIKYIKLVEDVCELKRYPIWMCKA